jgi:hypothetical protein
MKSKRLGLNVDIPYLLPVLLDLDYQECVGYWFADVSTFCCHLQGDYLWEFGSHYIDQRGGGEWELKA